jgi:hypothetical protein
MIFTSTMRLPSLPILLLAVSCAGRERHQEERVERQLLAPRRTQEDSPTRAPTTLVPSSSPAPTITPSLAPTLEADAPSPAPSPSPTHTPSKVVLESVDTVVSSGHAHNRWAFFLPCLGLIVYIVGRRHMYDKVPGEIVVYNEDVSVASTSVATTIELVSVRTRDSQQFDWAGDYYSQMAF